MEYAASCNKIGLVFEIQMGMIDRGADISWLSQYPHEAEILFAPLTGLEVASTRVRGSVLVVNVSLSVNLSSLTIEQVIGKRRKLLQDMANAMAVEVRGPLPERMLALLNEGDDGGRRTKHPCPQHVRDAVPTPHVVSDPELFFWDEKETDTILHFVERTEKVAAMFLRMIGDIVSIFNNFYICIIIMIFKVLMKFFF